MANPGRQAALQAGALVFGSDFESGNCWRVALRRAVASASVPTPEVYHREYTYRPRDIPPPCPLEEKAAEKKPKKEKAAAAGGVDIGPSGGAAEPEQEIYEIWVAPDCMDTPYEHTNRSWFHFSIDGAAAGEAVLLRIMNTNPHEKLFEMGMRPVWKPFDAADDAWERIPDPVVHRTVSGNGVLDIPFTFPTTDKVVVAFTYPYTYAMLSARLQRYEAAMAADPELQARVLYERQCVGESLDGQALERLTITARSTPVGEGEATAGSDAKRAPHLRTTAPLPADGLDGPTKPLAAEKGTSGASSMPVPCGAERFGDKPVVLVSCRVHPSETPASYILEGLLDTLLGDVEEGGLGERLREEFVFEIIPMLNPDGVTRGHCRNDTKGKNLNRYYAAPSEADTPSVYYLKEVFLRLHERRQLFLYLDLHAHHNKRGWFLYGNYLSDAEGQVESELLARLLAERSPHFDLDGCSFEKEKMFSKGGKDGTKEGSARVSLYKASGLIRCYTLEVNYNTSHISSGGGKVPPKYTPLHYREMGVDLGHGFLGLREASPEAAAARAVLAEQHKTTAAAKKEKQQRRSSLLNRLNPAFVNAQQQAGDVLVV